MRVLITGVGDAFTLHSFGSSALVEGPEGFVQIDCPDPIHRVWHEATSRAGWNASAANIHDVIITHLHGDHCNGLESYAFWRGLQRMREPAAIKPRLHITEAAAKRVWEKLAPAMDGPFGGDRNCRLDDFFDVHILQPQTPSKIAGLEVRCRFTRHPVPTVGLVLSDGRTSLGWSSDSPFEREHIEWLNQADVIVHESNLGPSHTSIDKLNELPKQIRDKIRLIHLPDGFDCNCTRFPILAAGDVLKL
jgi:ribonuclease BN (tRNA processing enzyme)